MNERISELITALGIQQIEFASKLNLSPATISKFVTGKTEPNKRMINHICNTFSVNEEWLLDGEGDMFINSDVDIASMMGKVFADDDKFMKAVFLTFSRLNDSERAVVMKVMKEFHELSKK
ncbi:MAG: helix-turn-helix transcriptional regulator [Romboutsia sp.]